MIPIDSRKKECYTRCNDTGNDFGNVKGEAKVPKYTLKDVAQYAGVSVTTASRALNDKPDISKETKELIQIAIKELGYVSNLQARELRTQRTSTIGIVISDNANPFFARVIRGIQDTASANGFQVILCNTDEDYDKELHAIRLLSSMQVAGILITPVQSQTDDILELQANQIPFVSITRYLSNIDTNYVVGNDALGGRLAVNHLIERGYQQLFCINGPLHISPGIERWNGCQEALRQHGITNYADLAIFGNINMEDGYRAAKEILKRAKPPFGIFCFSDYVAIGAYQALFEANLRIPEDVGLVGYDNIEFAPLLRVPLTTLDNPRYQVGKAAMEMLMEIIAGRVSPTGNHLALDPQLIIRNST
jgi:LacI family transcriptional regulator